MVYGQGQRPKRFDAFLIDGREHDSRVGLWRTKHEVSHEEAHVGGQEVHPLNESRAEEKNEKERCGEENAQRSVREMEDLF